MLFAREYSSLDSPLELDLRQPVCIAPKRSILLRYISVTIPKRIDGVGILHRRGPLACRQCEVPKGLPPTRLAVSLKGEAASDPTVGHFQQAGLIVRAVQVATGILPVQQRLVDSSSVASNWRPYLSGLWQVGRQSRRCGASHWRHASATPQKLLDQHVEIGHANRQTEHTFTPQPKQARNYASGTTHAAHSPNLRSKRQRQASAPQRRSPLTVRPICSVTPKASPNPHATVPNSPHYSTYDFCRQKRDSRHNSNDDRIPANNPSTPQAVSRDATRSAPPTPCSPTSPKTEVTFSNSRFGQKLLANTADTSHTQNQPFFISVATMAFRDKIPSDRIHSTRRRHVEISDAPHVRQKQLAQSADTADKQQQATFHPHSPLPTAHCPQTPAHRLLTPHPRPSAQSV